MKRLKRICGYCITMIFICIIGASTVHAEETTLKARNIREFRHVVYNNMLKREKNIVIEYSGDDYKAIFQSFKDEEFLDYIGTIDDSKTSDDYDYMVHNISYIKTGMKYGSSSKALFTINIQWRESYEELQYVNRKVKEILNICNIDSIDSTYERLKVIHDYIVENVEYDTSLKNENAFSALSKGSSTCQGYSLLYYKLLAEAGVDCRYITGTGISSKDTGPHGWNIVKIGDFWYNVDVTWDDPVYLDPSSKSSEISYDFFLKGSQNFDKGHKRDDKFAQEQFRQMFPTAQSDFDKRHDVKISETKETVRTTLEPVVIDKEDESDDIISKLQRTIEGITENGIQLPENFPKYIAESFKELDKKNKFIIIALLVLVVIGIISKIFSRKKPDYEELYQKDNEK